MLEEPSSDRPPDWQLAPGAAEPSAMAPSADLPYRELFLAVAEQIPDAIFTKDLQGRYTFINSAGARYLGLPPEQIIGRKDSDLMSPEEAQNTQEFDRQTLLAGRTLHAEMTEFMAGVRREWLSTKGLIQQDGQVRGLFGICRDLSEHRRSEAARTQSEALFRAAASSNFDAFCILRNEPEGLRLLRLNPHAEALLSCTALEAEGRLLSDFPQASFIAPAHLCEEVWRTGKSHDDEVEQVLPRQGRRWFRRQLNAVGDCMAVMVRDITEQRESEMRLRLNERMAAIGMLAAGVAHEINNPLAFVSSNLCYIDKELRRLKLSPNDLGEMMEAITDAREGADRMRDIVQSLRALARGDSITTRPMDLQEVLENSVHLIWGRLRSRGGLVRDYADLPQVMGNSVQLSQVFVNLLINAVQALPQSSGEIRLVTRLHSDTLVRVEVHDNGCGIPAEHLNRIFEPFFTTKPVGEGTGLGLSISHDIIRGLGGELTVSSIPGKGTTFRILLPVAPADAPLDEMH
ncbi:ATP-binding protein [Hyalangium rubrum]|uniref:histidine kinase n=1 Tax=Hyalangium rubrum TaxID=3103134 RepID=A0ABU5HGE8_9BACT|nr:ATP-binding protein [Hyalangium sp. s54d21]MDY7232534.1 PAS domain-containing protein [Hyalangium sp. s54d21]